MGWGCKVARGKIAGGWMGDFGRTKAQRNEGATKNRKMVEVKLPVCSNSSKDRSIMSDYGWEADSQLSGDTG